MLLGLLVEALVPDGRLVLGVEETFERRRGKKIAAKGVYRDPLVSTRERFVKTSGLRWICVVFLAEVPWASRVWALPFLSALAHSERYAKEHNQAAQETGRLGLATAPSGETLVPAARDRRCR